ncbi:hypothetical protein GO755_35965 [Spirosoma sp. HMF4905]|uniref:Galactose oxidase n=1 Tax=Spirosoma arboris TaxID=2682092 RepID=A0A7K1SNT7_9BACT|nr:hypothetical protein [Spirosoma arboris]MVM35474.1 hypothetical protein [Spirosoma arboris]
MPNTYFTRLFLAPNQQETPGFTDHCSLPKYTISAPYLFQLPSLRRLMVCSLLTLAGCKSANLVPVVSVDPSALPQASLVSIQAVTSSEAELVLKRTQGFPTNAWRLTLRDTTGQSIELTQGDDLNLGSFSLIPLQAKGLINNRTYQAELRFLLNYQDSVTALRTYTHRSSDLNWKRLPHAPLVGGDFTAYPVTDEFNNIVLARYAGADQMQVWQYVSANNGWIQAAQDPGITKLLKIQPRRGVLQFNLFFKSDRHYFYGLGYAINEQGASRFFYYHDLWCIIAGKDGLVVPTYEGEEGEVAFFIAKDELSDTDQAYFLTQNGTPAMRSINADFPQLACAPLPEAPGTLATFTVNNVGYVVNQSPGQPVHLWAYNPRTDTWQQRANFPGTPRSRGVGFSLQGKGYYGLGAAVSDQAGLRDLWQYDPTTDQWQYATQYPGQGNRYVAVLSTADRVYLGWGYESQRTTTGIRQVACTDWWTFQPK